MPAVRERASGTPWGNVEFVRHPENRDFEHIIALSITVGCITTVDRLTHLPHD
jgi:hypothetical protein